MLCLIRGVVCSFKLVSLVIIYLFIFILAFFCFRQMKETKTQITERQALGRGGRCQLQLLWLVGLSIVHKWVTLVAEIDLNAVIQ